MAPPKRPKSMAEQIAELADTAPKDFDPEDIDLYNQKTQHSSDSDSEDEADEAGREHYETVGKSRLRKPAQLSLGAAYHGSRISRNALEDSDEDDPFSRDFSASEDEADHQGADEETGFDMNVDSAAISEDDEASEESLSGQDSAMISGDESSQNDEDGIVPPKSTGWTDKNELRRMVIQDQQAVASALSQAAKTDVAKGNAIKKQRAAFDSLLNVRIKLQRALISSNSMLQAPQEEEEEKNSAEQALEGAETAARRLWNTLESLKASLHEARVGEKRKHMELEAATPFSSVWDEMQSYEKHVKRQRNANLDMWASKTRAAANASQSRRLNDTRAQQTLTNVLSDQLADMARLVAKTQVPRSCAPVQAAARSHIVNGDTTKSDTLPIYDDADFYGPLLQALIAQRSSDAATLSAMNVAFASQPWQAAREAKTKKMVDTKASKGRRLRYTAHEAVQNIMAADSLALWSDRQCDELFASLHGRIATFGGSAIESEDESPDLISEGLRLFAGQ